MAFKGSADSVSAEKRVSELENLFTQRFADFAPRSFEAVYSGPRGNRKLTTVVLVDLGTEKAAQAFVRKHRNEEVPVAGCTLSVKPARTELNTKRNNSLRDAEKALKASPLTAGKTVEVKWSERKVTVNSDTAFSQNKTETGGTFCGVFSGLTLP